MLAKVVAGLFWVLSKVPPRCAIACCRGLSKALTSFDNDVHRVTTLNIGHAFPDLDAQQQAALVRDSLTHLGLLIFEMGYLRYRSLDLLRRQIHDVEGEHLLQEAAASGEGVILLMPHLGCWEFMSLYLGRDYAINALYDPPHQAALEPIILRARQRQGARLYPAGPAGLRHLVKGLRQGELLAILPDQLPGSQASGVIAPFFDQPALTMLLIQRLSQIGRPRILYGAAKRQLGPEGIRYTIQIRAADADLYSEDALVHAQSLNAGIEAMVRAYPEQYQWSYKRFRRLGSAYEDLYRRQ